MVLIAACAPSFATGSTLKTTPLGPLVRLDWNAAADADVGQTIARYQIEVDRVVVGTINAPATKCVLTGLPAGRTYSISVTAYDSNGDWSGLSSSGRLTKSYTTPSVGGAGSSKSCVPTTDTDGDRLPNAVETNNGTYVSAASTGTSPTLADTDGDSLRDGDETLGTTGGLNLGALGAPAASKRPDPHDSVRPAQCDHQFQS